MTQSNAERNPSLLTPVDQLKTISFTKEQSQEDVVYIIARALTLLAKLEITESVRFTLSQIYRGWLASYVRYYYSQYFVNRGRQLGGVRQKTYSVVTNTNCNAVDTSIDDEYLFFGEHAESKHSMLFFVLLMQARSLIRGDVGTAKTHIELIEKFHARWRDQYIVTYEDLDEMIDSVDTLLDDSCASWKLSRTDPPKIAQIFELSHLFQYVTTLHQILLGEHPMIKIEIAKAAISPAVCYDKTLLDIAKKLSTSPKTTEELVTIIFTLVNPPTVRDAYLMHMVNSENKDHHRNRPRVKGKMPRLSEESMVFHFKDWYDKIRNTYTRIDLDYSLLYEIDKLWHQSVQLAIFSQFLREEYQVPGWLYTAVIPYECIARYWRKIADYAAQVPIFIQLQPYIYHVFFRGIAYYHQDFSVLLGCYVHFLGEGCAIPVCKYPENDTPWIFMWKRWVPLYTNTSVLFDRTRYLDNLNQTISVFSTKTLMLQTPEKKQPGHFDDLLSIRYEGDDDPEETEKYLQAVLAELEPHEIPNK